MRLTGSLIGVLVVAAVATLGDYIWYEYGVEHRAVVGVLHGAALLTAVGGVLGAAAGRLAAGLPMGTLAGVAGALAYYGLVPMAGGRVAMIAAWAALWIMLAALDGRVVRRPRRTMPDILTRGAIAALLGGLAFAAVVGTLWGRPPAGGRNYLLQFGAWALAWTPGILAIATGAIGARGGTGAPGATGATGARSLAILLAAGFAAAGSAGTAAGTQSNGAGSWPQWRGPGGLGLSAEQGFVTEWSPTSNVRWKTPVPGRGHSSPVVWGNRVFLTTAIKGKHVPGRKAPVHLDFNHRPGYLHPEATDVDYEHTLQLLAIDAGTGRVVWTQTAYDGVMYDDRHQSNTFASPTVATDGRLVYAFFESLGVFAYDFDGRLKWKTDLGPIIKAGLGPGTSPVLYERLLILQCDQEMGIGSFIVALDRETGKEVWRTARQNRRSWATPLLVRAGGRVDLVASGAEAVVAYDPATGTERWRANGTDSHPIPSPVAAGDLVILTAGSQAKRVIAVKLGATGDLTNSPSIAWRYNRGTAYVASPVVVGDQLYLVSDAGIVTSLRAATGEVVYEGGRMPIPATVRASLVAFGETILVTSEEGDTFVLKAGTTHEVVRTNSIGEAIWASPALANGTIYLRGSQHLYAIGATVPR